MTDTIDIIGRQPPVEVRKPWRQKLPECYAMRVDDLKDLRRQIEISCSNLRAMHREFGEFDACLGGYDQEAELQRVRDQIAAALVLFGCADDKLLQTIPTEELMPRESLDLFGWR